MVWYSQSQHCIITPPIVLCLCNTELENNVCLAALDLNRNLLSHHIRFLAIMDTLNSFPFLLNICFFNESFQAVRME